MSIFSCEDCPNAIIQNDKQIGCAINLADSLGIEESDGKFFELGRVCLSKNDKPDVKLGYIFILKDKIEYESLLSNLLAIKSKNPIWIGISNGAEELSKQIIDFINTNIPNVKFNIITNYDNILDTECIDKFTKSLANGWTYVNIVGQYFNPSVKDLLQKFIIQDSQVACLIKDSDTDSLNNTCFFNFIYKYLKGSKPKVLEDDTIELKTFFEKVQEQQESMIFDWSALS